MNAPRKNSSLMSLVGEAEAKLREMVIMRPLAWWEEARVKMRDLPKTNFVLGCDFLDRGLLKDAIFRFKMVLWLKADYPRAWFNLGCCYFRSGQRAEAVAALKKALAQEPTNQHALFMIAALDASALQPEQLPIRMPDGMVANFFTPLAANYDSMELANQYQGGQLVFDALKSLVKLAGPTIVDVGCGTGIASRSWRTMAKEITGVDSTPAMAEAARAVMLGNVKLFDHVIAADITKPAEALAAASADVLLCVNVAPYIGALETTLQAVKRVLKPGGFFVITTEAHAGSGNFGLSPVTGRFGHNPAYVKQLAANYGLTAVREQRIALYPEQFSQLQIFQAA